VIEYMLRETVRWLAIWFTVLLILCTGCTASRDAILAEDDALLSPPAVADLIAGGDRAAWWQAKLVTRQSDRAAQKGN